MAPRAAAAATALLLALAAAGASAARHRALLAGAAPPKKVLILTEAGYTGIDFLENVLTNYSIPYETTALTRGAAAPNITALLWDASGTPKFHGWIMYPNVEAAGLLKKADVLTLWRYQAETGARSVKFGAWSTYVGFSPNMELCSAAEAGGVVGPPPSVVVRSAAPALPLGNLSFTAAAPFDLEGVQLSSAFLSTQGLWRCPGIASQPLPTCSIWGPGSDFEVTGLHPNCTSTPIMEFTSPTKPVAAVLVKYTDDGRDSLAYTLDCAAWSSTCSLLGKLSIAWLMQPLSPRPPAPANGTSPAPLPPPGACSIETADEAACRAEAAASGDITASLVADLLYEVRNPPPDASLIKNGTGDTPAGSPKGAAASARAGAGAAAAAALLLAALL